MGYDIAVRSGTVTRFCYVPYTTDASGFDCGLLHSCTAASARRLLEREEQLGNQTENDRLASLRAIVTAAHTEDPEATCHVNDFSLLELPRFAMFRTSTTNHRCFFPRHAATCEDGEYSKEC